MKVILPPDADLNDFEGDLHSYLVQSSLSGLALLNCSFAKYGGSFKEIDALVLLEPAVFVCIEAKGYRDSRWTGNINSQWRANHIRINAAGKSNPHKQANSYSLLIKNILTETDLYHYNPYVIPVVVAPDDADIHITDAVVNHYTRRGSGLYICNLSYLDKFLEQAVATDSKPDLERHIQALGGLHRIAQSLLNISEEQFERLLDPSLDKSLELEEPSSSHLKPIPILEATTESEAELIDAQDVSASQTASVTDTAEEEIKPDTGNLDKTLPDSVLAPDISTALQSLTIEQPAEERTLNKVIDTPTVSPEAVQDIEDDELLQPDSTNPFGHTGELNEFKASIQAAKVQEFNTTSISPKDLEQQKPLKKWVAITTLGILALPSLIFAQWASKTKLDASKITIGTLWKPESQQKLTEYLEDNVAPSNFWSYLQGKRISIVVDGDKTLAYTEAKKRMRDLEWDIAFTTSPILSIFADDLGYDWGFRMFPGSPFYQSGLFVRNGSPIQSIDDVDSQTRIALGGFNSSSSFYYPVYALYGKTIKVETGNRGQKIVDLVRTGKADVGAAAIGDSIREDSDVTVIHVSRDLPSSSVYFSPQLSEADRKSLKALMRSASDAIQNDSNFGEGNKPDYTELRKIVARVEEVTACADFSQNPVRLFCDGDQSIVKISGTVNGVSSTDDAYELSVQEAGKFYRVVLPQALASDLDIGQIIDLQGRSVQITVPSVQDKQSPYRYHIKRETQIQLLN